MNFNRVKVLLLSITLLVFLAACGDSDDENKSTDSEDTDKETIVMGQINWAENIAVSNMWKVILEDEGYELELKPLDMGTIMAALETGDLDIGIEVWLPVQDANYLDKYSDTVDFAEESWYETAQVGLVVPEYMEDINSIEDLNANKDLFDGIITGFDPGAGTMEVTEDLIEEYNLDYELLPSSEPAMLTEVREAMKNEEPIVAPLWSPHSIFAELDLKFLEDPKGTYGGVEEIYFATREGFSEDHEEVSGWLNNWLMDDDTIGELMSYVEAEEDPFDGAEKWVEENEDLVNEWLK